MDKAETARKKSKQQKCKTHKIVCASLAVCLSVEVCCCQPHMNTDFSSSLVLFKYYYVLLLLFWSCSRYIYPDVKSYGIKAVWLLSKNEKKTQTQNRKSVECMS